MYKKVIALAMVLVMVLMVAAPVAAQDTYDEDWLRELAGENNAADKFRAAFNSRSGDQWRSNGNRGTYDVPAHSAILAVADMDTGNDPAFEKLDTVLFYTAEGGRFGSTSAFFAFQLDGAPVASTENRPITIDDMIGLVALESDYGRKIASLDQEFSASYAPINRWGTSGPLELLSDEQLEALEAANLDLIPVLQQLPGNTIVWGELAPGDLHTGLVLIEQDPSGNNNNIYATTCQGGIFATYRGFRAMQFEPASPDAIIPDTTGCNGDYPVLDPDAPASAQPN